MKARYLLVGLLLVLFVPVVFAESTVGFKTQEQEFFRYSWGTLAGTYELPINKQSIAFTEVSFKYKYTAHDASITITPTEEVPATPAGLDVYQYLDVKTIMIREPTIADAKIKFEVEKDWVDSRGKIEDVQLLRYEDDARWVGLPTEEADSDYAVYRFESETPGFSYFAIAMPTPAEVEGEPVEEEPQTITQKITAPKVEEDKDANFLVVGGGIALFLMIVFVALSYLRYKHI